MSETVSVLRIAIGRQNWEAVALCLWIGLLETLHDLSPRAVEELVAELEEAFEGGPGTRQGGRR